MMAFKTSPWTRVRHVNLSLLSFDSCVVLYRSSHTIGQKSTVVSYWFTGPEALHKGQIGSLVCPYLTYVNPEIWWKSLCVLSVTNWLKKSWIQVKLPHCFGVVMQTGIGWEIFIPPSRECLWIFKFTVSTFICLHTCMRWGESLIWPSLLWFKRKTFSYELRVKLDFKFY